MAIIVFLLGRPGSGKSTVAREWIAAKSSAQASMATISDYPIVRRFFHQDGRIGVDFVPTKDKGFLVLNPRLFDIALDELARQLRRYKSDIVIVEFARANYAAAIGRMARRRVWPVLTIYLQTSFRVADARNRGRARYSPPGSHVVSAAEMAYTYRRDDLGKLRSLLGRRLLVLRNSRDGSRAIQRVISRGHAALVRARAEGGAAMSVAEKR